MSLNIRPSTSQERKAIFLQSLLNGTNKVSKVSSGSVLDGVADGVAKVAGKAEKDVILAVSQLFPDTAFSDQLDQVAPVRRSLPLRRLGSQSPDWRQGTYLFLLCTVPFTRKLIQ